MLRKDSEIAVATGCVLVRVAVVANRLGGAPKGMQPNEMLRCEARQSSCMKDLLKKMKANLVSG